MVSTNQQSVFRTLADKIGEQLTTHLRANELLHFPVPSHGKLWKSLMRSHLRDYLLREKRMRALSR